MIKKLIALFLLLSIIAACPAMADPFTVRQGVRFGMSKAEVQLVEGSEGQEQPAKGKLIYTPVELEGVAIGRASSETLYYKFNLDRLWEVQFWSGYYETETEAQAAFDTWEAWIEMAYGDCLDAETPTLDTSCLQFYKGFYNNFDEKCVRSRKLGLTVDGEQIVVDLFILPSMDDFNTFCIFDCPAYAPANAYR